MLQAMATKDTDEVERIRAMGVITTSVVGTGGRFPYFTKKQEWRMLD